MCNCVMYQVLHLCTTKYKDTKAGFIHVPYACEQVVDKPGNTASMPLDAITKSLEYAIEAAALGMEEKCLSMGTTC